MSDITLMLQAVERGEKKASEDLLPTVYEELRRLAAARMALEAAGQTLQPTALVHEAWLQLVGGGARSWQNRAHFFGAAADAMRRILIDKARRKSRLKHGGGQVRVDSQAIDLVETTPDDNVLLIDEALQWLEKDDPEQARVVVLKFFGGLTNQEVAETLGVGERTALSLADGHEGRGRAFTAQDVRFTQKKDGNTLYAIVMGAPQTALQIKSLGLNARLLDKPISEIILLGIDEKLKWSQTDEALVIEPPQHQSSTIALVFKIVPKS